MKRSKTKDPRGSLLRAIDDAIKSASTSDVISDEAAHETRKSLKRARAALRLLRPVLGDAVYHREDTVLKTASRSISPLRDARAQVDVVDSLRKRYGQRSSAIDLGALNARTRQRLARIHRKITRSARTVRGAVQGLNRSRQRLSTLTHRSEHPGQIANRLRKMYRQGRKALKAAKQQTTTRTLHELRKKAKYLSNAVRIVGDGSGSAGKAAKRAEQVADWLGEDHDLSVLMSDLRRSPRLLDAQKKMGLRSLIARRRRKLQKRSLRRAIHVYRKKPKKVFA